MPEDPVTPEETYPDSASLAVEFFEQDSMGCSRAAFAMAMHFFDPSITLSTVTEDAPIASDGGSPNMLMAALAERLGFETRIYPGSINDIIREISDGYPVIVAQYWDMSDTSAGHDRLVVGYDRAEEELTAHDPAVGEDIAYSYDDFSALWGSDFSGTGGDEKYYMVSISPTVSGDVESRVITVDGYADDWMGMTSFSPDREDDCSADDSAVNIKRMYVYKDDQYLYLMVVFADTPASDINTDYFFNFYYAVDTTPHIKQFNFRYSHDPWVQTDDGDYGTVSNVQWAVSTVLEARLDLNDLAELPDYVAIRAGTYDFARAKNIDLSYANAYRIR